MPARQAAGGKEKPALGEYLDHVAVQVIRHHDDRHCDQHKQREDQEDPDFLLDLERLLGKAPKCSV